MYELLSNSFCGETGNIIKLEHVRFSSSLSVTAIQDLKVSDNSTLVLLQLLSLDIIDYAALNLKHGISENGFCLQPQVKT
jgi:hypothetical protein